jgi:hypothetical protein
MGGGLADPSGVAHGVRPALAARPISTHHWHHHVLHPNPERPMKSHAFVFALLASLTFATAAEVGVRIRFGLTDTSNTNWDGTVAVAPGSITSIDGWRFQQTDKVEGTTGWKAETRPLTVRRSNAQKQKQKAAVAAGGKKKGNAAAAADGPIADNGVVLHLADVTEDSVVSVTTPQGKFSFKLAHIPYGEIREELGGAVDIERTAASRALTKTRTDDDFPAVAVAPDGTSYVAHVSFTPAIDRDQRARPLTKSPEDFCYLATPPGGDQLWLRTVKNGVASEPMAVTAGKGDIYKTALAIDGSGAVWIFWSENHAWQTATASPNFEIWARSFKNGSFTAPVNLSQNAGSDVSPVAATDKAGRVWVAWQACATACFASSLAIRARAAGPKSNGFPRTLARAGSPPSPPRPTAASRSRGTLTTRAITTCGFASSTPSARPPRRNSSPSPRNTKPARPSPTISRIVSGCAGS